jgi:putative transposase
MGIARSTYYDKPAISIDDTALVETMVAISESFEAYGYRRMRAALRHRGLVVNHKKIRRLMRDHDLQPRRRGDTSPPLMATMICQSSRTWQST